MQSDVLDCRGMACPKPVVETKKRLDSLPHGMLTVLVDNGIAKENLLKLAGSLGLDSVVREEEGVYAITVRKEENGETKGNATPQAALLLTGETMGRGNDELGALLIRSFFYALAESDRIPAELFLINSAVKLACNGSEVLQSLQKLAVRGCSIHSCGICLDYFKLKEQLAAGEVTNMYAIAARLMSGDMLVL